MTRHSADPLLLTALVEGRDVGTAAKQAGVSLSTARRRLNDPEFKSELQRLQGERIATAVAILNSTSEAAALTLRNLLGPGNPPSVRLQAAVQVINLGSEARKTTDFEQRLAALEAQQSAATETPTPLNPIPRKGHKEA